MTEQDKNNNNNNFTFVFGFLSRYLESSTAELSQKNNKDIVF